MVRPGAGAAKKMERGGGAAPEYWLPSKVDQFSTKQRVTCMPLMRDELLRTGTCYGGDRAEHPVPDGHLLERDPLVDQVEGEHGLAPLAQLVRQQKPCR